jgi:hypothetical protein
MSSTSYQSLPTTESTDHIQATKFSYRKPLLLALAFSLVAAIFFKAGRSSVQHVLPSPEIILSPPKPVAGDAENAMSNKGKYSVG